MIKVNGKPYGLKYNIQSHCDIAKICPNGDMNRFGELFQGGQDKIIENEARIAIALNKGYEDEKKWKEPDYEPCYLTREDIMLGMDMSEFLKIESEIMREMKIGKKQEVEAEVPKAKSKNVSQAKEHQSD